jgi:SAM-dependent methyltransferase
LGSPWLVAHRHLLPRGGRALDVACGRGRNALWLASEGMVVRAIDRDEDAVVALNADARRLALPVEALLVDLEADGVDLGRDVFDLVLVVHYLHRPLFPHLIEAVRPGGLLIYETFTRAQAARGKPSNPAFLLDPGELRRICAPLQVLEFREGEYDGRAIASIVARRPLSAAADFGGLLH